MFFVKSSIKTRAFSASSFLIIDWAAVLDIKSKELSWVVLLDWLVLGFYTRLITLSYVGCVSLILGKGWETGLLSLLCKFFSSSENILLYATDLRVLRRGVWPASWCLPLGGRERFVILLALPSRSRILDVFALGDRLAEVIKSRMCLPGTGWLDFLFIVAIWLS